jgi:hypothetical protein
MDIFYSGHTAACHASSGVVQYITVCIQPSLLYLEREHERAGIFLADIVTLEQLYLASTLDALGVPGSAECLRKVQN